MEINPQAHGQSQRVSCDTVADPLAGLSKMKPYILCLKCILLSFPPIILMSTTGSLILLVKRLFVILRSIRDAERIRQALFAS